MINTIPEVTLVITVLAMVVAAGSGISRRLLTNVEETKRLSSQVSTFNKDLRQAMMKGDKAKETKLKKKQPQMKKLQAQIAKDNMKPTFAFLIPIMLIWWVGLPALVGPDWTSIPAASSPISLNILPFWPLDRVTHEVSTSVGLHTHSLSVFAWYLITSFSFQGVMSKIFKLT